MAPVEVGEVVGMGVVGSGVGVVVVEGVEGVAAVGGGVSFVSLLLVFDFFVWAFEAVVEEFALSCGVVAESLTVVLENKLRTKSMTEGERCFVLRCKAKSRFRSATKGK